MKTLLSLIFIAVVAAPIIGCSSPTFEEDGEAVAVSLGEAEWVLLPNEDEYILDGVVRSFYRKKSGPYAVFCGTMTVEYELSDEEFYEEFGEPGPLMDELNDVAAGPCGQDFETFLRMRDATIVPLSDDRKVFRALCSVKPGDKVYLEGKTADVDSVEYQDEQVKRLSNIVLVDYVEVNGKSYGY